MYARGVIVPDELAAVVARAVAEYVRRHRPADDAPLRRLVTELASTSGHNLAPDEPAWSTAREVAITLGVSARTVRRRVETGQIERRKVGAQWVYRVPGSDGSHSPSASSGQSPPR